MAYLGSSASTMTDFWWCVNMLPFVNFCVTLSSVPPSLGTMAATTFVLAKYSLVSCSSDRLGTSLALLLASCP